MIIPVDAPIVNAEVPSESVSSLPEAIDHVREVVSPVVAIVAGLAEQLVDSA